MRELDYSVNPTTGHITVLAEGRKLSEPWEFEPPPYRARKRLRQLVGSMKVRAAWALYGSRVLPGHLNALRSQLPVIEQVMRDNPRLLPVIVNAVNAGTLKATPTASLVQRLKAVVCATDVKISDLYEFNRYGAKVAKASALKRRNEVVRFWANLHWRNEVPLTPAGWRFFARQAPGIHRQLGELGRVSRLFHCFNFLGEIGAKEVGADFLWIIATVLETRDVEHAKKTATALVRAYEARESANRQLAYRQIDVLRDWWHEEKPLIPVGSKWENLVARAVDAAATRSKIGSQDTEDLTWAAPVAAFVTAQAVVVTPLLTGAELIEEGHVMGNCLKDTRNYAIRALQGRSQVFRLQAGQGRATVEMVRGSTSGAWRVNQCEGPSGAEVTASALLHAVEEIEMRLNAVSPAGGVA